MTKLLVALKSRTAWVIVVMFLLGGVENIKDFIPSGLFLLSEGFLSVLAIYFRVNRKAD